MARARDAGRCGLAFRVRDDGTLEDPRVQRAEPPHVGDVEERLGGRAVAEPELDADPLEEELREAVRVVGGLQVPLGVEGEDEAPGARRGRQQGYVAALVEAPELDRIATTSCGTSTGTGRRRRGR